MDNFVMLLPIIVTVIMLFPDDIFLTITPV